MSDGDSELRFTRRDQSYVAELYREGKPTIELASIRCTLIASPDTKQLFIDTIDVLLHEVMARHGVTLIELSRTEGE